VYFDRVCVCVCLFIGVLFALKVVSNYMDPSGTQYVMGLFPVPTKLVCWAELVLIHLMVPNASFLGENLSQIVHPNCYTKELALLADVLVFNTLTFVTCNAETIV